MNIVRSNPILFMKTVKIDNFTHIFHCLLKKTAAEMTIIVLYVDFYWNTIGMLKNR